MALRRHLRLVGAALSILTSLNSLPQALYEFDTTRSCGGFLSATVISTLLQGLVIGAMILVVTASGETLYRSAYPRKMALPKIFTWQGFRTKEVFFSTLGGTHRHLLLHRLPVHLLPRRDLARRLVAGRRAVRRPA